MRTIHPTAFVDSLESRLLLAGNVTANFQGDDLIIRGDAQDNAVMITSTSSGRLRITGIDQTRVNGKSAATMSPLSGNVIVRMRQGGEDRVAFEGPITLNGNLEALMGRGEFVVEGSAGPVRIEGDLDASSSKDAVINVLNEVRVRGTTSIETGGDTTAFSAVASQPNFSAANFKDSLNIDNPYFPVVPGSRRVYESRAVDEDTGEVTTQLNTVEVGTETRTVAGVKVRILRDRVFEEGLLIEDTRDFHAQDDSGNVWYFGEDVINIEYDENGQEISRDNHGSWAAGLDGALPGIIMEARPRVGRRYFQEFAPGNVLDHGEGLATNESATVPVGTYQRVFRTEEGTVVEPFSLAEKLYAPGIGTIAEFELDLEDREVEETIKLQSATLNGKAVKTFVPTSGFDGTNVGGRLVGPGRFDQEVIVASDGPIVFNGTQLINDARLTSDAQVIVIDSTLASASLTSGDTVSLNHVQSEGIVRALGDTDLLVANSEIEILKGVLGSGDNDVVISDSEIDVLFVDGGAGRNTFDQQGSNDFDSVMLKRLTRI
jgi:hypothetical protein